MAFDKSLHFQHFAFVTKLTFLFFPLLFGVELPVVLDESAQQILFQLFVYIDLTLLLSQLVLPVFVINYTAFSTFSLFG